jgi:hypothetical protein
MKPLFYWGLEYETSLLLYDPNGFNSKVIWKDNKVKLTCEVFDKKHGNMNTDETGYWDNGKKSDQLNQRGIYIIESQIGLFSGFDLKPCFTNLNLLQQKLTEMVDFRQLIYNYHDFKSFPVFTYSYNVDENMDTDYFLDYSLRKPGLYILDSGESLEESESTYFGYRAVDKDKNDMSGVPQLTCSFELHYFPLLLKVMAKYTRLLKNKESYHTIIEYTNSLHLRDRDAHAFIMYLVDYYIMYLQYDPSNKEDYFKSFFDIKPRTNPAALYATLSAISQKHIQSLYETLSKKGASPIDRYLIDTIYQLNAAECVFIGKTIDKKILPGLYTYDSTDEALIEAIETHVDTYNIEDSPCVNMPDPLGKQLKRLPEITYDEDTGKFKGGFPIDLWEWNVKNNESPQHSIVSLELRDFNDLVHMSLIIMKEYGYDTDYEIEGMDIDIHTFKKGLDLVFKFFFPTVFQLPIRPKTIRKSKTKQRRVKI